MAEYYRNGNYAGDVPEYKTLRTAEEEDRNTTILRGFDPRNRAVDRSRATLDDPKNSLSYLRQNKPTLRNPARATPEQLGRLATDAVPVAEQGRSDQAGGGYGLRAADNARYSENFARDTKRIVAKRGLTRAQRSAQLGLLETKELLRQNGIEGEDAQQALDLAKTATRRGLTRSQRTELITAGEAITGGLVKDKQKEGAVEKTFTDRLLEELDLYGDDE